MNDVGRRADAFQQSQSGAAEKCETLVIFGKSVNRAAMKKFGRVNQKSRRTVRFAVKRFSANPPPAPVNPQIIQRQIPEIFAFCLPIARRNQQGINADLPQSLGQRARDIA
jgi:hypothetical protein